MFRSVTWHERSSEQHDRSRSAVESRRMCGRFSNSCDRRGGRRHARDVHVHPRRPRSLRVRLKRSAVLLYLDPVQGHSRVWATYPERRRASVENLLRGAARLARAHGVLLAQVRNGQISVVDSTYAGATNAAFHGLALSADTALTECLRTGQAIWLSDAATWKARYRALPRSSDEVEAVAVVPVAVKDKVAVLGFTFSEPRSFDRAERTLLVRIAEHFADQVDVIEQTSGPPEL
jgi:GAF domain